MKNPIKRREFLQTTTAAGLGITLAPRRVTVSDHIKKAKPQSAKEKINVGIIGVGLRGQNHLAVLLNRDDVEVPAICDISDKMIEMALSIFDKKGKSKPKIYGKEDRSYLELLEDSSLDAVIIATPWLWHTEMAIASMRAGKYVGTEVCGGFSLDECWSLVHTHQQTGTHLYFMENVCYRRDVMAVLNMVRENMFGRMVHGTGGYQHDLRGVKFNDGVTPYNSGVKFGEDAFSEAKWRTKHSIYRNGDLYPTHGVGPLANSMNINRGNRFMYLTSMATGSNGIHNYIVEHPDGGENHPNAKIEFKLGDIVHTSIRCANDETIILWHDTNLPRPYSLGFRIQGTKGLWMVDNNSLYIEGVSPAHKWEDATPYLKKYDHPLWVKYEKDAQGSGHGGMDFFLINSFVESAKRNEAPPLDVYDAATWLAITPLSEASIASGSKPMPFPDFTNGWWTEREPSFGLSENY